VAGYRALAVRRILANHQTMSGASITIRSNSAEQQPPFLTTKEVADLLRVKERKVYDLAAANEIPHRRITGKLLFPAAEIMAWIDGGSATPEIDRPAVLTGSHDPLLDWAVRESGSNLATLWNGSLGGLEVFAEGRAALSGLHVPDEDGWNVEAVASRDPKGSVLIAWATRTRGLLVSPELEQHVRLFSDIKGRRVVNRQPGSGATALLESLMKEAGLDCNDIVSYSGLARTETDAAVVISAGDADAALGIEAMARQFHLGFVPLREERFDLLVDRRSYFTRPVQTLLSFARTDMFRTKAEAMGGYGVEETGTVRWLGT
jgi:putative molybdopterin biosynthesis protein